MPAPSCRHNTACTSSTVMLPAVVSKSAVCCLLLLLTVTLSDLELPCQHCRSRDAGLSWNLRIHGSQDRERRGRDYCFASLLLWLSEARPAGLRGRQLGIIYTRWIAKSPFYRPWPSTNSLSGLSPFQNTPITVTTHRPYSTKCFISQLDGFQLLKLYQNVEIQKTLKVWLK